MSNDIIPPVDNTSVIINGVKVSSKIKNPIKGNTDPIKIYNRDHIPKRIRKKPVKIDLNDSINTVVDNIIVKGTDVKIKASSLDINKDEIKRKLINVIEPLPSVLPDGVPVSVPDGISSDVSDVSDGVSDDVLINLEPIPNRARKIRRTVRKVRRKVVVPKENSSEIPNYDKLNEDEKIIYRNTFKLKFDTLRKIHPGLNIQAGIEDHPSLYVVHQVYEVYLTEIYKQINSNMYRGALLLSWVGLELFGTHILGLDCTGYCKQQIDLLWAYEPIINELSQVNFSSITEGWSPFQKLIGLIFGTFVFMIVIKLVLGYIGSKTNVNLEGLTSTVMTFISNMVVSKPDVKNVPPIVIQTGPVNSLPIGHNNLGGIHNIPIPQPSTLNPSTQIGLVNAGLSMLNAYKNNQQSAYNPQVNQPVQNIVNPIHRNIRPPSYNI